MNILLVAFLALAAPHQPFDYTGLYESPQRGVTYLHGVLGFSRDCHMAIYPDRVAAITRDASTAFALEWESNPAKVPNRDDMGPYVHQYADLEGRVEKGPVGFVGKFVTKTLPQEKKYGHTSNGNCTEWSGRPIGVLDALLRGFELQNGTDTERTLVYGYSNAFRDYYLKPTAAEVAKGVKEYLVDYALYPSREEYEERRNGLMITVNFEKAPPSGCEGRLMLVDGNLDRRGISGGNHISLRNAHVIEDTCDGNKQ